MQVAELFATLGLVPDEKSWDKGHELIDGLHHAIEAYLGYEGLKKVKDLVEGTVEAAVEAKHLGERLNITGEAVQELGYAADVTGASAETMTAGLQRLAAGLEHAKKGSGPLVDAMHQLHIPIANLRKENLEQNLEEIANGFANAGPNVNKLALAIEIFGRNAGPRLLPLLNRGAAGIAQLREEAHKLGVVIDEEGIQKAEEFEIAQKKLGYTLKGLRNEAVIAIVPALQEMAESLQGWIMANREAIVSGLKSFLEGLIETFRFLGKLIYDIVGFFNDHREALAGLLVAIGLYATASIAAAVASAAAWVLAAAPFLLIAGAIAGVILIVKKLWDWIENGDDIVAATIRKIISWFSDLVTFVQGVGEDIVDAFNKAFDIIVNLPVIKQLIQLVKDLREFAGMKPPGSDEAHEATKGTALGALNDFANDHPIIASLVGGGSESARRDFQERAFATGAPAISTDSAKPGDTNITTGDTTLNLTVNGTNLSPDEIKAIAKDAHKEATTEMIREAKTNLGGARK